MSDPALRIFPDDFVPNVQASDAYKRWARSSPADRARWETFRDALFANPATAVAPVMSTRFGKALAAAGKEHMSISQLVGQVTNPYPPPTPPPAPPPTTPYFDDQFDDPNFSLWLKTPSSAVPSLINLVSNGEGGNCVRLITTPTSSGPNPSSEMTSLWQGWNDPDIHTERGEETWYRIRTRFPSGSYFPTTGEWNWHFAWHNNDHTASYGPNTYSTEMGVTTDFPVVPGQVGQNPRLWVQMMGGNSASPTVKYVRMPSNSLLWDHWYDIVFKFVWGTRQDGNGWFGWWVDGQAIVNESFPVLYDNPDGSHDTPGFGIYNYHLHDPVHTSEVQFDRVLIGPSAASIGFVVP